MRIATLVLVSTFAVMASGCFKSKMTSCNQSNKDYAGAQEVPPLQAPPGLDAPNTRNALKVPPLNTPERVRGKDEPCLDIPPPFSTPKADARPATPAAPAAPATPAAPASPKN
ncbi:MAG TPA: hypothetical protein VFS13_20970 [Steroidobacteraceae bacterium]|jgi:uncharacterized lipoprotein|nr:hypothetical protein [Steroidobacteraceae bacterium]